MLTYCAISPQRKKEASTSSSKDDAITILKEEILELKKSLDYNNKEVEFHKFEVEKMRHQID